MSAPASPRRRLPWPLLWALPILGLGLLWGGAHGPLGLAEHVGYAICHQIQVRSYVFGDLTLPLCARCTGQYLAWPVVFLLAWRWRRLRAAGLPPRPLLLILIGFLLLWAFDGFNSYLTLLRGRPWLYAPHNLLRLITGLGQGLALGFLFLPLCNQMLWAEPDPQPLLGRGRELAQAVGLALLLALAVHSRVLALFYPLSLLSTLSAFALLSLVGMLLLIGLQNRVAAARRPRDLLILLPPGMAFAVLLLLAANLARAYLEQVVGLPPLG